MNSWKYIKRSNSEVVYLSIPLFEETSLVKCCFTTRLGGVSSSPWSSMNLGLNTEDSINDVKTNYKIISEVLDINYENLVISDQVHKDNILIVKEEHKSNKLINNSIKEIDSLITNNRGIALVTLYADCVPIFILDKKNKVVALAHAGWRGTVKKISKKTIKRMMEIYDTNPKDCLVAIGPSIGGCCYEVDDIVVNHFKDVFNSTNKIITPKSSNKYLLDLWEANKLMLLDIGILHQNITISKICTMCNNDLFFSYRGENGNTGRMAAIIQLI